MSPPVTVLLPGLDGTADLFRAFLAAAPVGLPLHCQPLPTDRPRDYRELAEWVRSRLPAGPIALIAESFSGPLALLVADRCPRVVALVLCASFVEPPLPGVFAYLPEMFWRRAPPVAVLSMFLTGGDRALAQAVRVAMAGLGGDVVASRIAAALRVDVKAELERLSRPLLCLQAQQDRVVPARSSAKLRTLKPSAQFESIAAPHLLLQTCPEEAWRHIQPFLERASEGS
jgi:pimeloyl-ACP methyl ester carboxylesterase